MSLLSINLCTYENFLQWKFFGSGPTPENANYFINNFYSANKHHKSLNLSISIEPVDLMFQGYFNKKLPSLKITLYFRVLATIFFYSGTLFGSG